MKACLPLQYTDSEFSSKDTEYVYGNNILKSFLLLLSCSVSYFQFKFWKQNYPCKKKVKCMLHSWTYLLMATSPQPPPLYNGHFFCRQSMHWILFKPLHNCHSLQWPLSSVPWLNCINYNKQTKTTIFLLTNNKVLQYFVCPANSYQANLGRTKH